MAALGAPQPCRADAMDIGTTPYRLSFAVPRFRSSFLKGTQPSEGGESGLLLLCLPAGGSFALHGGQASVVVRVLRQMSESYLSGDDRIVPADVGLRASATVFELHVQSHPELLEVVLQRFEVHSKLDRDDARLGARVRLLDDCFSSSHGCLLRLDTSARPY